MAGLGRQTHFAIGVSAIVVFGGLSACSFEGRDAEVSSVREGTLEGARPIEAPSDVATATAEAQPLEEAEAPAAVQPRRSQDGLLGAMAQGDRAASRHTADDTLAGAPRQRRASPARPAPTGPIHAWGGGGATAGAGPRPTSTPTAARPGYGLARAPAAPMPRPLPQNGVLASNFVGGSGAQARLEDLLDRGVMVGGQNVRLEAFDELGRLPYPVPAEEAVGLHAELERSRLLTDGERVHLQIALMARRGEAPPRPRMDVRLVFDRSGSMMGDKWTHAIDAAHALVDRLQPGDTFGLVSYSDDATVDLAPERLGDRRAAHAAIRGLVPGGGTNIEAALRRVSENAPRRRQMNDVLLVVLVSDGVANVGQTNAQELGSMARSLFDDRGVLTTSVGLGTDFDEETMLTIAREGSGSYHFVRRTSDIGEILTDELEDRAQAVAQALRLRVELGEGVVATRVYGSRLLDEQQQTAVRRTEIATDTRLARELGITRDRQEDEDRGLRIHLPTFRRGDQHVILMELTVPRGTSRDRIAHISLDYKDLLSRGNRGATVDVNAERTTDREAALASTRRPVKRTVLAFQAGDALQGASDALQRGDLGGARELLADRQRLLVAASDLWHDPALARDAELLSRYERVLNNAWGGWDTQSQRTMMMAMSFYGDRRMR